jgi:hypothetical protein
MSCLYLLVACRSGTPAYWLESKTRRHTATCPTSSDLTSLLGRSPALLCVSWLQILSSCSGGLRRCHVSCASRSCLPAWKGSGAVTCPMPPDPAFLLGRAPTLPRVPRHQILPPYSGRLRRCHVSHGSGSCLFARDGSGAATYPAAPDPASLLERAPALPHVPQHKTSPPCSGGASTLSRVM